MSLSSNEECNDGFLYFFQDCKSSQFLKSHKTPWSKVKDIIQTRTGSIKKKRVAENDFDEETAPMEDQSGSEDNKDSEVEDFCLFLMKEHLDIHLITIATVIVFLNNNT